MLRIGNKKGTAHGAGGVSFLGISAIGGNLNLCRIATCKPMMFIFLVVFFFTNHMSFDWNGRSSRAWKTTWLLCGKVESREAKMKLACLHPVFFFLGPSQRTMKDLLTSKNE